MKIETKVDKAKAAIGQLMKQERIKKERSIYEIAKKAGIKIHQLQALEENTRAYTIDTFIRVYFALRDTQKRPPKPDEPFYDFENMITDI